MKILLFGKNGQVGSELQRSLAPLGDAIMLDRHSADLCGDLTNLSGLAQTVRRVRPDVIVNAAAHTAVDKAESEPELARTLNALAPGVLAQEAGKLGALLVHFSTDYVFDGSGHEPWKETDMPAPLCVYGQTKLEGEQFIQASGCGHLIFRTSWVYAARGGNFAKIDPVPTTLFPTPATRPLNSRLDTGKLKAAFGLSLPPWQQGVARMLAETL